MVHKKNKAKVDGDEWQTPDHVLSIARHVLGPIELDPCSTPEANERVKAKRFWTKEDDALAQPYWNAKTVWLNPPYSRGKIKQFTERIVYEVVDRQMVGSALVLTNASTSAKWWQHLARHSRLICFPAYRISFIHPHLNHRENSNANNSSQSLFFLESSLTSPCVDEEIVDKLAILGHVCL